MIRKRKGDKSTDRRQEWSFLVLRWPLLVSTNIPIPTPLNIHSLPVLDIYPHRGSIRILHSH